MRRYLTWPSAEITGWRVSVKVRGSRRRRTFTRFSRTYGSSIGAASAILSEHIGVTACLVMKREGQEVVPRKRKREQSKEDARNGGPRRGHLPQAPHEGQRLVGIDNIDMIGVVSNEGDTFTVSTKSFLHMSGNKRYARQTTSLLTRKEVGDSTLYDLLQKLPCRRDVDEWSNYLRSVLPILDTIIATYEVKRLRRMRFQSFMKRDKTLDAICARITASIYIGECSGSVWRCKLLSLRVRLRSCATRTSSKEAQCDPRRKGNSCGRIQHE